MAVTGEICQSCGNEYQTAMMLPDVWWNAIRPKGKPLGSGLLCAHCIVDKLESIGKGNKALIILHVKEVETEPGAGEEA